MIMYIGTQMVNAKPMTRLAYNQMRGWVLPLDENGADEGYLVESFSGEANTPDYDGYISWSPKAQFEGGYNKDGMLTFGQAVLLMKKGQKLARIGWNGKGMWIIYNPGSDGKVMEMSEGSVYQSHGLNQCEILPHFDMYTLNAHGRRAMLPGWLASQSDINANDWCLVA